MLLIIAIPSFISILNNSYFNMHDDNHIVRLYLLDVGIKQGNFFPRWVDGLGFGYGYPLYNFYPPLIYYIAEVFHLLGLSLVISMKSVLIIGFILATFGMYLFAKKVTKSGLASLVATVFYNYFFYHATTVYVRGAFAEFFTMSILPFILWAIFCLFEKPNLKNSLILGITFSLLILNHPLIAFPFLLFLIFIYLFLLFKSKERTSFTKFWILGFLYGLCISGFFWIPSIIEKNITFVDAVLTKDLYNYKLHFIYLSQLWYSPWGFGASVPGPYDGISFQIGKVYLLIFGLSFIFALIKKNKSVIFFGLLTILSIFMSLTYSQFIWDNIKYFWYIQFPWRFFTFTAIFISITNSYFIFYLTQKFNKYLMFLITLTIILFIIYKNFNYFKPQRYLNYPESFYTSDEEIKWHVSRNSFEFAPYGIATTKTDLGVITLDVPKEKIPKTTYLKISGDFSAKQTLNNFSKKIFKINSKEESVFRLNTYNFPGWTAYINNQKLKISDNNRLKLITVNIPKGEYELKFVFENTNIRTIANIISIISIILGLFLYNKKIKDD